MTILAKSYKAAKIRVMQFIHKLSSNTCKTLLTGHISSDFIFDRIILSKIMFRQENEFEFIYTSLLLQLKKINLVS